MVVGSILLLTTYRSQTYNDILSYATACIEFAEKDPALDEYEKEYQIDLKDVRSAVEKVKKKLSKYKPIELN